MKDVAFDKLIELVKMYDRFNLTKALSKVIILSTFSKHCATMQILHGEHK